MVKQRIDLTIDADLVEWLKKHAKENRTNASSLVNQYLAKMKAQEEKDNAKKA